MTQGGASVFPFLATVAVPLPVGPLPVRAVRAIFPNRIRNLPHCSI
jgi:hypothetical protein